ncbi:MAG: protein translocase subunit SecF [Firmicutes bacterium]|nr:protein translocase subunit SecF [Bacillota bacterium]
MAESKQSIIDRFRSDDFKIAAKGKWYAIAPAILAVVGIILFFTINFNLGLDFTGGRMITVSGVTSETYAETRATIERRLNEVNGIRYNVVRVDGDGVRIDVEFTVAGYDPESEEVDAIATAIHEYLVIALPGNTVNSDGVITARASTERILNTFMAVGLALILMLLYMLFRFKFTAGVAAIIGLMHDVLVMLALTMIFRIPVNQAFIAALITVVGYSINNTLILADRIRGKEKMNTKGQSVEEIVDSSVKETFARTMNTTITTLVPVFALIVFGVPLIREFAIPIMFGLIAGTFSTIFVVTSLYVRFETYRLAKQKHRKKLESKNPAKA